MKSRGSFIRKAFVAFLAAVMATFAFASVIVGSAPGASAATEPAPVRGLGFYPGFANVSQLTSLENWLGRQSKYVVQFGDTNIANFPSSVWGEVVNAGAMQTLASRVTLAESIPLAFGSFVDATTAAGQATARNQLQATANGSYDSQYRQAAQMIRDGGFSTAIIRLGWEFDGGWMPWSAQGNCALFQSVYRRVHDIFTSVSPGFRFDWNGTSWYFSANAACGYPGDSYVDMVGLDQYDMGTGAAYNSSSQTWVDPTGGFNTYVKPNLVKARDFAIAHGKQVSYPEWALAGLGNCSPAGGDDPAFIQGMYDWMNNLPATGPGSLAYQSYFQEKIDFDHRITSYPNAKARYRQLFGA